MVKEFRRPAAGKEVGQCELRPMPVLVDTVKYLLGNLLQELGRRPEGESICIPTSCYPEDRLRFEKKKILNAFSQSDLIHYSSSISSPFLPSSIPP